MKTASKAAILALPALLLISLPSIAPADYPAVLGVNERRGLRGGRPGRRRERAAAHSDLWSVTQHVPHGHVCEFCHGEYSQDVVA
jgi:hypothetical protein